MQDTKIYDLYLSLIFKIFVFGMLGLLLFIGIVCIVADIFFFANGNGPPWFFGIFMILIAGWNFYYIFSFPHRITLSDTDEILFTSLLRSRKISVAEIKSIKPDPSQFFGFLIIKTQNRKIKILNQFDGFHDFILNLKVKNQSIELRGC
jgi:hypothetical protein